jgi:hypothetical protein
MRPLLAILIVTFAISSFAAPNQTSAFFTTSDGVRLHYVEAGDSKARAIVFEPGWTMPRKSSARRLTC